MGNRGLPPPAPCLPQTAEAHLLCAVHKRDERLWLRRLRRLVQQHVLEAQRRDARVAGADARGAHDVRCRQDLLFEGAGRSGEGGRAGGEGGVLGEGRRTAGLVGGSAVGGERGGTGQEGQRERVAVTCTAAPRGEGCGRRGGAAARRRGAHDTAVLPS